MPQLSRARTLPVPFDPQASLAWPSKYQNDVLDYALNPASWLKDGGDRLSSVEVTLPPDSGLTLLWWGVMEAKAALALAGGTVGSHLITLTLTTNTGRVYIQTVRLDILSDNLPSNPVTPPRLPGGYCVPPSTLSEAGTILTLPNTIPLTV